MGRTCVVFGCTNSQESKKDGSPIHLFPRVTNNDEMRRRWIQSIGDNIKSTNLNLDNHGVCTRHFREHDYAIGFEYKSNGLLSTSEPSKFPNSDLEELEEIRTRRNIGHFTC